LTHAALQAVAELIRTQTLRIEYDGIPDLAYQLRAPCLLAQLAGLVGVGSESGGRGIPGPRPTINVDVLDLWVEIVTDTAGWCDLLGIDRRTLRDPMPAADDVHTTPAAGKLLRSCAATAISKGFDEVADRIRHNATTWRHRIEALLTGHTEQRGVRGATCPECQATSVVDLRDEGDRQVRYRVPAIALVVREHQGDALRWLVCNACGWHQPLGESLDDPAGQAA
jgi:hypothetical protein